MSGRGARRWHVVARLKRRQGLGPWPSNPRLPPAGASVIDERPVAAFSEKARAQAVAARLNAERHADRGPFGRACQYLVVSADTVHE